MTDAVTVRRADLDSEHAARSRLARFAAFRCWRAASGYCADGWAVHCGACGRRGHGNCYGDGRGPVQIECCGEEPDYFGSLDAATTLLEPLRERGFDTFALQSDPRGWDGRPWMAVVSDGTRSYGYGTTPSEALSRAVLDALDRIEATG